MSQSRRAMIECIFGWGKQHGTMRKTKHRGIRRIATDFLLNLIAYNLSAFPNWLRHRRTTPLTAKKHSNDQTHHQKHGMPEASEASISRFFSGLLEECLV